MAAAAGPYLRPRPVLVLRGRDRKLDDIVRDDGSRDGVLPFVRERRPNPDHDAHRRDVEKCGIVARRVVQVDGAREQPLDSCRVQLMVSSCFENGRVHKRLPKH